MAEQKMHGFRARLDYILKHNYAINRIFNWMASSFMKVWGYFIPLDDEMVIFSGGDFGDLSNCSGDALGTQ